MMLSTEVALRRKFLRVSPSLPPFPLLDDEDDEPIVDPEEVVPPEPVDWDVRMAMALGLNPW